MESDADIFVPYKIIGEFDHLPHPEPVLETRSLSVVTVDRLQYCHNLPAKCIQSLSGVKHDAVILAGEAFSKLLKGNVRQDFAIGK